MKFTGKLILTVVMGLLTVNISFAGMKGPSTQGTPVAPLEQKEAEEFVRLLDKDKELATKYPDLHWYQNNYLNYQGFLVGKDMVGADVNYYVYKVDINNDSLQEYLLATVSDETHAPRYLDAIFQLKNEVLIPVDFKKIVRDSFHLTNKSISCDDWYCFLADPFITSLKGRYYMQFVNHQDAKTTTCLYIWQGNQLKLVTPNPSDCIGALHNK